MITDPAVRRALKRQVSEAAKALWEKEKFQRRSTGNTYGRAVTEEALMKRVQRRKRNERENA